MIERIEFNNYKALRSAVLPLGAFTLIVGPNGSGKTTALRALDVVANRGKFSHADVATSGEHNNAIITIHWGAADRGCRTHCVWIAPNSIQCESRDANGDQIPGERAARIADTLSRARVFSLDSDQIAREVRLVPAIELSPNGYGLAGVLDRLRDGNPERSDALKRELPRWFPEYDNLLFETTSEGARSIALRTISGAKIAARDLSQGTLLALTMLTLAHLPDPPPVIGFEEPDRGIHPRLLREIQDALYRLAYPESAGEDRPPVQVIATTHSPYFLDLFKEHPEEIVIAQKHGTDATFERLSDRPDIEQILEGASLGDVWYSGILGGVPVPQ